MLFLLFYSFCCFTVLKQTLQTCLFFPKKFKPKLKLNFPLKLKPSFALNGLQKLHKGVKEKKYTFKKRRKHFGVLLKHLFLM